MTPAPETVAGVFFCSETDETDERDEPKMKSDPLKRGPDRAPARAMLVAAAGDRWKVAADLCRTEASVVSGPSGQRATYAELAGEAGR